MSDDGGASSSAPAVLSGPDLVNLVHATVVSALADLGVTPPESSNPARRPVPAAGGTDDSPPDGASYAPAYIAALEWLDVVEPGFEHCRPPAGVIVPQVFPLPADPVAQHLSTNAATHPATAPAWEEYQHLVCYGVFTTCALAAAKAAAAALVAPDTPPAERAQAAAALDAALNTLS